MGSGRTFPGLYLRLLIFTLAIRATVVGMLVYNRFIFGASLWHTGQYALNNVMTTMSASI